MTRIAQCTSLAEVRHHIDLLDRELVGDEIDGRARDITTVVTPFNERAAQVLAKVNALAIEAGADAAVVDATWRAMIAAFIDAERLTQAALHPPSPQPN